MFYWLKSIFADQAEKDLRNYAYQTISKDSDSNEAHFCRKMNYRAVFIGFILMIFLLLNSFVFFPDNDILIKIFNGLAIDAFLLNIILCNLIRTVGVVRIYTKGHPDKAERTALEVNELRRFIGIIVFFSLFTAVFAGCYIWYIARMIIDGPFIWSFVFDVIRKVFPKVVHVIE